MFKFTIKKKRKETWQKKNHRKCELTEIHGDYYNLELLLILRHLIIAY